MSRIVLNENQKDFIISNYNNMLNREIAEHLQVKVRSISNFLAKNKLKREDRGSLLNRRSRKYTINEKFFNNITEKSSYWAGFILADAYITEKHKIVLKLQGKDYNHLIKFKKDLSFQGVVMEGVGRRYDKEHSFCRIGFQLKNIVDDLKLNFNVDRNKSKSFIPNKLDGVYKKYFIKGFFDGNGSRYLKNNKTELISFYGNCDILTWIKEYFDSLFNKNSGSLFKKGIIYCYQLNQSSSNLFIKDFEKLNLVELDRKWSSWYDV